MLESSEVLKVVLFSAQCFFNYQYNVILSVCFLLKS